MHAHLRSIMPAEMEKGGRPGAGLLSRTRRVTFLLPDLSRAGWLALACIRVPLGFASANGVLVVDLAWVGPHNSTLQRI